MPWRCDDDEKNVAGKAVEKMVTKWWLNQWFTHEK